jgi:hypothetical protein
MSRTRIFSIFIIIDLAIVSACVWSAFHHIPVRQYFLPAIMLFVLNGLWLVWITVKNTPPR